MNDAHAVGPVGVDAEAHHVGDDEEGRVLEGEGVLAQLVEGGVEVFMRPFVFPGEAVALPYVSPAAAAAVLARTALEAVALAGGVVLGWRRLVEQAAEVDEMLLGGGALFELGGAPLGDEVVLVHLWSVAGGRGRRSLKGGSTVRRSIFHVSRYKFPKALNDFRQVAYQSSCFGQSLRVLPLLPGHAFN
ncbi:MAG: hypothetical protein OXO48_13530 [Caldilineaceae bacterium]|nr:hypothetical protein [Caldilineaceae bacterium]